MAEGPVNYRLGITAIAVLIFTAAIADLICLIPFAGDFVGPVYWVLVSIFLYTKGFGILNARRFATSAISMVAEMIPGVQELPIILVGVIIVIVFSRIEDKTGIKIPTSKGPIDDKAIAGVTPGIKPANQDGVRQPSALESGQENNSSPRQPLNSGGVRTPSERAEPPRKSTNADGNQKELERLAEVNKQIAYDMQEKHGLREKGRYNEAGEYVHGELKQGNGRYHANT